jgi:CRP/FNR family transcriptional regulator, cyclic AMP receptor protein
MESRTVADLTSLRKLKSFDWLTAGQLERLAQNIVLTKIRKKELIFSQGQADDLIYLVISGTVRLSMVNQENKRVVVTLVPAGDLFGLGLLFPEIGQPFDADAFSDCTIGTIKREVFAEILLGIRGEAYLRFSELYVGRLWRMLLRCVQGIGLSLRKRLALELLELASSFGVEDSRGTILTVTPTHEDLANSIGASRQKVTECLAELKRERGVIQDGRRLIVVSRKLRRIVEKG